MSETTKRIEEIAKELFLISPYSKETWENLHPSNKIFWIKAATHLHNEVIRGKIEHTEHIMEKISKIPIYGKFNEEVCREILADLQRQIKGAELVTKQSQGDERPASTPRKE